ncbi:MAG TPA: PrgI family protein [Candidatus Saccharimonadales bacterium]|nr:PrgI family protein [Candidatus Saccharimonadales bacterium]
MSLKRHEIPTHLNVEDRAFYGLSVRQVMYLTVGCALSYGLWNQWPDLPVAARLALAATCFLLAVALAFIRPAGRGFEEWAIVALRYVAVPKIASWRPVEPDPLSWRPLAVHWEELSPTLGWQANGNSADPEEQR